MLFNSLDFFLFFPLVVLIYFLIPQKARIIFLLLASYFFYASWKAEFLSLIIFSTLVDFFIGKSRLKKEQKKLAYTFHFCQFKYSLLF